MGATGMGRGMGLGKYVTSTSATDDSTDGYDEYATSEDYSGKYYDASSSSSSSSSGSSSGKLSEDSELLDSIASLSAEGRMFASSDGEDLDQSAVTDSFSKDFSTADCDANGLCLKPFTCEITIARDCSENSFLADVDTANILPYIDLVLSPVGGFAVSGEIQNVLCSDCSTKKDTLLSGLEAGCLPEQPTEQFCEVVTSYVTCEGLGYSIVGDADTDTDQGPGCFYDYSTFDGAKGYLDGVCRATSSSKCVSFTCHNGGSCIDEVFGCMCPDGYAGFDCSGVVGSADVIDVSFYIEGSSCSNILSDSINGSSLVEFIASQISVDTSMIILRKCEDLATQSAKFATSSGSRNTVSHLSDSTSRSEVTLRIFNVDHSRTAYLQSFFENDFIQPNFLGKYSAVDVTESVSDDTSIDYDCSGTPFGLGRLDSCNVCKGHNDCLDCSGRENGTLVTDACGICGGFATTSAECSTNACSDNADFLDEQMYSCADWKSASCLLAINRYGYSESGFRDIVANCPKACQLCTSDCYDDATFRDEGNFECSAWIGFDCSTASSVWRYSADGESALLEHCPRSCGLCGVPSYNYKSRGDHSDSDRNIDASGTSTLLLGASSALVIVIAFVAIAKNLSQSNKRKNRLSGRTQRKPLTWGLTGGNSEAYRLSGTREASKNYGGL